MDTRSALEHIRYQVSISLLQGSCLGKIPLIKNLEKFKEESESQKDVKVIYVDDLLKSKSWWLYFRAEKGEIAGVIQEYGLYYTNDAVKEKFQETLIHLYNLSKANRTDQCHGDQKATMDVPANPYRDIRDAHLIDLRLDRHRQSEQDTRQRQGGGPILTPFEPSETLTSLHSGTNRGEHEIRSTPNLRPNTAPEHTYRGPWCTCCCGVPCMETQNTTSEQYEGGR